MSDPQREPARRPWWRARRGALAALGLGATLALSPLVMAENPPAPQITGEAPRPSFAPLVKRVLPAVVNISVTEKPAGEQMSGDVFGNSPGGPFDEFLRRFFERHGLEPHDFPGGPPDESGVKRIALGSGFIIDPEGHIVTNNHVIGEAAKVEVILQDNSRYTAKIVGRDSRTDIAVLKIDAGRPLPYVTFGDSNAAQVGDWVVAVGNPFGLGGSVTTGIISARGRDIHAGQFDDFLQIDAPINRGNSGGPTFNLDGQVIGINTAIYSPNGGSVGIGFAVPSNVAKQVVQQLEEHGKVRRGWLGVQIQAVTPAIAASLGLKNDHGALVAVVTPDSAAAKAGLKQGDVITAFNGNEVKQLRDLSRLVSATQPGSTGTLTVWRDGKAMTLSVTVGEAPENPRIAAANPQPNEEAVPSSAEAFGMHFAPLTREWRRELQVGRDVHGVVIARVDDGSVADTMGLTRGDILEAINQEPVHTPREAAERLKETANSPRKNALLLLNRHGVTQYVGIDLGPERG
jgi:serine protease Do